MTHVGPFAMTRGGNGIDRRAFLQQCATSALSAALVRGARVVAAPRENAGELLYNGIRLSAPWPPVQRSLSTTPILPAYLADPPDVIPIDVGRQLFVDDFLIEENMLERTYHAATYHAANPVLSPTKPWERFDEYAERTHTRSNPAAMPFSDGLFYDPHDRLFKMWYMGGYSQNVCYAVSGDGLTWEKPQLDVYPGTNITLKLVRDSSTVWLDPFDRDPRARFKLAVSRDFTMQLSTSPDGVHWRSAGSTGWAKDRTTFFFNPFRNLWIFSIRDDEDATRVRRYWEARDFVRDVSWKEREPVLWVGADSHDPRRPEYNVPAQLYNLDCVAYESVLIGLFTIWRGETTIREKPNDIVLGYSRDGFHFHRPDRRPFIPVSEHVGDWNWANVQSTGGVCTIVGDRLHFYVSGRRGVPGTNAPGVCSTGLATLRRDGFASLADPAPDAPARRTWPAAAGARSVTTRPVRFSGSYLFVNADARGGAVRVEVLDREGRIIAPFSAANCRAVTADGTRLPVSWTGPSLAALAGQTVRFRFLVSRARLYAFWVSAGPAGTSRGYVAAGGPAFNGPVDSG